MPTYWPSFNRKGMLNVLINYYHLLHRLGTDLARVGGAAGGAYAVGRSPSDSGDGWSKYIHKRETGRAILGERALSIAY